MKTERKILYYKDYFVSFYRSLDVGAQKKIDYVLAMLKIQERVNERFVKFIRDGIYEIRASHNGNIYRAFFIFDEGNIVMLFHGFQKKTQKTPESEITKVLKLKKEYYYGHNRVAENEREAFHQEAYAYCVGQMICDARKEEKVTQSELAKRVGTNKSYISKIENGVVDPSVGLFLRIIDALGLKFDIIKPAVR